MLEAVLIGGSLSSVRLLFAALDARRRRTQAACLNRRIGRANFHHDSRPRDNQINRRPAERRAAR